MVREHASLRHKQSNPSSDERRAHDSGTHYYLLGDAKLQPQFAGGMLQKHSAHTRWAEGRFSTPGTVTCLKFRCHPCTLSFTHVGLRPSEQSLSDFHCQIGRSSRRVAIRSGALRTPQDEQRRPRIRDVSAEVLRQPKSARLFEY